MVKKRTQIVAYSEHFPEWYELSTARQAPRRSAVVPVKASEKQPALLPSLQAAAGCRSHLSSRDTAFCRALTCPFSANRDGRAYPEEASAYEVKNELGRGATATVRPMLSLLWHFNNAAR